MLHTQALIKQKNINEQYKNRLEQHWCCQSKANIQLYTRLCILQQQQQQHTNCIWLMFFHFFFSDLFSQPFSCTFSFWRLSSGWTRCASISGGPLGKCTFLLFNIIFYLELETIFIHFIYPYSVGSSCIMLNNTTMEIIALIVVAVIIHSFIAIQI